MSLAIIAAVSKNYCIGINNQLPWHIPEDMKHFKELTTGKTVLMGRRTWESLPEKFRPLPNRKNIVITKQEGYSLPSGVEQYKSIEEATTAHANDELFVIGGAETYRQTIDLADTLYLTEVDQTVNGDAFFPVIEKEKWQEISREKHDGFSFVTYKRYV